MNTPNIKSRIYNSTDCIIINFVLSKCLTGGVVELRKSRVFLTNIMFTPNGWDRYGFEVGRFSKVRGDKKSPESIFSDSVGAIFDVRSVH